MPRGARLFSSAVLLTTVLGFVPGAAEAVPAFARRYETSCAMCHVAYPRLNGVGESFRLNGFQFVDDERYRKIEPVELGDEAYKRLWPRALWPTDIPRRSPLSFVSRLMVEADLDGSRRSALTWLMPEEVELVWAGNLGKDIAFYGDTIFLQKDFGGANPDSWATVKAWLQFSDVVGPENLFNVRLGSVGTQTMGLFTARDANFYGTHFYLYTNWGVPAVDLEANQLAEFAGNNFFIGPQAGLEVNGFGRRWYYALGLVDGDLETPVNGAPESDVSFLGMGRGTGGTDVYLHLAYKVGGIPFDRSTDTPDDTLTPSAEFWRDDSLTLSLYAYSGTAEISALGVDGTRWQADDDFWRLALGIQKQIRDVSLSIAWMAGEHDDPYGELSGQSLESTNWHVEMVGFVYPWLMPYVRYEGLDLELPLDVRGLDPDQDMARVVAGAKLMIRPNVSCTVEGAYYTEGAELEEGFDQTLFVLVSASF